MFSRSPLDPGAKDRRAMALDVSVLARIPSELGRERGYGKINPVNHLHSFRDEARFDGLEALRAPVHKDIVGARAFFQAQGRQTTRDRI